MRAVRSSACWGVALSMAMGMGMAAPPGAGAREKYEPDPATIQLFQVLNTSFGGKVEHFCLLGDTYTDASGQQFRHVLRVDYDKSRGFGRLNLYVRSVGKMTPDQLATYTPQQIYDFGESDQAKFVKTDTLTFGAPGDLYLEAQDDGPLHSAAITDAVRKRYSDLLTQYVIPALQKGPAPAP
jgi:hypothetical protein